jgi:hypothetical protein
MGAPVEGHPTSRFVVSRRTAGIGDLLINLVVAWRFAERTGRTLVADWRGSRYLQDREQNLFPTLFEPVDDLAGVPFVGDARVAALRYPEPFHPHLWSTERLALRPPRRSADVRADRDAAVALIRVGGDVPAPTVVFDGCLNDACPPPDVCRRVLSDIRPVSEVRLAAEAFRAEHLTGGPVVAVHLRHHNGSGTDDAHHPYWVDFGAAIDRCAAAAAWARQRLGQSTVVFLATDSRAAEDAFRERVRDVIVRPKFYRRPGDGELHRWPLAFVTRMDALVDMLLLAASDALVRFPPGSFFSFYPAVMKPRAPAPADAACGGPLDPAVVW